MIPSQELIDEWTKLVFPELIELEKYPERRDEIVHKMELRLLAERQAEKELDI